MPKNFNFFSEIRFLSMFRQAQHDRKQSAFVILSLSKDVEGGLRHTFQFKRTLLL